MSSQPDRLKNGWRPPPSWRRSCRGAHPVRASPSHLIFIHLISCSSQLWSWLASSECEISFGEADVAQPPSRIASPPSNPLPTLLSSELGTLKTVRKSCLQAFFSPCASLHPSCSLVAPIPRVRPTAKVNPAPLLLQDVRFLGARR